MEYMLNVQKENSVPVRNKNLFDIDSYRSEMLKTVKELKHFQAYDMPFTTRIDVTEASNGGLL